MCQLVAILIHLFLCRYECRKFGFWGAFLAGRFCVYITQMNFHFYRFYLFCSFYCFVTFYRFSILFLFFYCFVLLLLIRGYCATLPRYHVIKLPYYLWSQLEVSQLEVSQTCHIICALCAVRRCRAELLCG